MEEINKIRARIVLNELEDMERKIKIFKKFLLKKDIDKSELMEYLR